jgi:hypothetical protein
MDGDRFDGLTRRLGRAGSRRELVQLIRAGTIGAVAASVALDEGAVEAGVECEAPPGGTAPGKSTTPCECMTFTWNPVPTATAYIIRIDGVKRFQGPGTPAGGKLTTTICDLPRKASGSYRDCFRAANDCGKSEGVCGRFNTVACPT